MAVNKPVGDNARKGAVKKRTQRKTKLMGNHLDEAQHSRAFGKSAKWENCFCFFL